MHRLRLIVLRNFARFLQVWIQPGTGLADDFLGALESLAGSSEATMALILLVFAIAHSGLAGLRPKGES